jgi:hypothetical protein
MTVALVVAAVDVPLLPHPAASAATAATAPASATPRLIRFIQESPGISDCRVLLPMGENISSD